VYFEKEEWKNAVNDFDKFIKSSRQQDGFALFRRGLAKLWLKDKAACKDFKSAIELAAAEHKDMVREWYNKYCN
jgi:hypothetical protein